ncbi:MAG: hypothetical protein AAF989_13550 [Planctomycetota bacterium]
MNHPIAARAWLPAEPHLGHCHACLHSDFVMMKGVPTCRVFDEKWAVKAGGTPPLFTADDGPDCANETLTDSAPIPTGGVQANALEVRP